MAVIRNHGIKFVSSDQRYCLYITKKLSAPEQDGGAPRVKFACTKLTFLAASFAGAIVLLMPSSAKLSPVNWHAMVPPS